MKIKAFILAFVFLFGGNGLSVDIAQCCNQFAGVALSLNAHQHEDVKECCACATAPREKGCCDDVVIQTVINPVLAFSKAGKIDLKQFSFKIFQPFVLQKTDLASISADHVQSLNKDIHLHDPVPVLIKKRVLQI